MASHASRKIRLLLPSQKQVVSDSSISACQDTLPDTLSRSHQSPESTSRLFARTISQRGFFKVGLGTILGLPFATTGWPKDHRTAPDTEPVFPGPPAFSQDNFPDRLEHQPGPFISRDQTRLLLAFKVRQTPASLKPFLHATRLALEELRPQSSSSRTLFKRAFQSTFYNRGGVS